MEDIELDDLSEEELKKLDSKLDKKLKQERDTKYPYGKPENNLRDYIRWMQTEFFESYEQALAKTDYKAIRFFTEYLNQELEGTGYEDMRASLEELNQIRTIAREMLMNLDPETLSEEDRQEIEDFINEEAKYDKGRGYPRER